MQQPEWARPGEAHSLLPIVFAGAWNDVAEGDRQAVSELAQLSYDEVSRVSIRWSNEDDPPVRRVGNAWFVASKEDCWSLLARYLTRDNIERFEKVALNVLGTPDPQFDLPNDQQWMAGALGHAPQHSGLLREAIMDTLAFMGTRGDSMRLSAGISVSGCARRIVRDLLEKANSDWRVWASLSHNLSLLAEAAPDEFLAAAEQGLTGEDPVLLNLFTDQEGGLFNSSSHPGLLWALETLAWNSEYLGRVTLILGRLARLDPEGQLANRPKNSLRSIFLPWLPQTSATLEQRLRSFDLLRTREPAVAWNLLCQLLPQGHDTGHYSLTPRWRDWAPDTQERITRGEYATAIGQIAMRTLADVGEKGDRWQNLIEALPELPIEQHEAIVQHLANMDVGSLSPSDCASIWNALRGLISRHRSFQDANWSLPAERIDRLDGIFQRFEPQEPAARYGWLFSDTPELPEGHEADWDVYLKCCAKFGS